MGIKQSILAWRTEAGCVAFRWFRASRLLQTREGQEPRRPASHLGEASAWSSTALPDSGLRGRSRSACREGRARDAVSHPCRLLDSLVTCRVTDSSPPGAELLRAGGTTLSWASVNGLVI